MQSFVLSFCEKYEYCFSCYAHRICCPDFNLMNDAHVSRQYGCIDAYQYTRVQTDTDFERRLWQVHVLTLGSQGRSGHGHNNVAFTQSNWVVYIPMIRVVARLCPKLICRCQWCARCTSLAACVYVMSGIRPFVQQCMHETGTCHWSCWAMYNQLSIHVVPYICRYILTGI